MVMGYVIASCSFLGAWLLVAGPLWQAAIELREEEVDEDSLRATKAASEVIPPISRWWWLLPPVAYVKEFRRQRANRRAFNAALSSDEYAKTMSFLNKANGWITVAVGAFLLAVAETWNLVVDVLHWPQWAFWLVAVVFAIAAVGNAVARVFVTEQALHQKEEQSS